jgi:hypothetical protein
MQQHLQALSRPYLGDQGDLVLQDIQTLGSLLRHFFLVSLQGVRHVSNVILPHNYCFLHHFCQSC